MNECDSYAFMLLVIGLNSTIIDSDCVNLYAYVYCKREGVPVSDWSIVFVSVCIRSLVLLAYIHTELECTRYIETKFEIQSNLKLRAYHTVCIRASMQACV